MIVKNKFRFLLFISQFVLIASSSFSQNEVIRNPWVNYDVSEQGNAYEVNYSFLDHLGNTQHFSISIPMEVAQRTIDKFGIPNWLFEPYVDNNYNRAIRQQEMEQGLFQLHGDVIEVDKSKTVAYYCETFGKPIAQMIEQSLAAMDRDTRRDRIEMAMRFIQDIPYGTPLYSDADRHYGGVNVPPKLLLEGKGDCDSKALLFVSILIYLIPANDIIFLNQKDHLLTAIKGKTEKGLTYVRYKGENYLIAETAGPGKRLWGEKGNYYRNKFRIENLDIDQPQMIDYQASSQLLATTNTAPVISSLPDNTLILKNENSRYFQFQISTNKKDWKKSQLKPNQTGKFVFNSTTHLYLRFKANGVHYSSYEIDTGHQYDMIFDAASRKWEIKE